MIYTSRTLISIRNLTRKLGLNKFLGAIFAGPGYEDRFGSAILSEVHAGDCVWDIGANVGLYTTQFAERAGSEGVVVAFEPVPACYNALLERTKAITIVRSMNVAMGDVDGEITMALDNDDLAPTHQVAPAEVQSDGEKGCTVEVRSAESVIKEHPEWFPNVIKIDVEGYEGAVFDGLISVLKDTRLQCIGIEMHFGLLDARSESDRPKSIERTLKQHYFNVRWTDASHLVATR